MGRGETVRRRASNVVRAKLEKINYAVLPPPPAADAPDKLPRSLRRMLAAKAADDARTERKAATKAAAAAAREAPVASGHGGGVPLPVNVNALTAAPAVSVAAEPPPPRPAPPKPAGAPPPAAVPSKRKEKRRERSKALKARKKAARHRAAAGSDGDDGDGVARAAAPAPAFGETAAAPINVTLKTKHWGNSARLGAVFERQLADARARTAGGGRDAPSPRAAVSAADRVAVIEAYRARKGGAVGAATRTSLKALVAAGAARAVSAGDAKRVKR